MGEHSFAKVPTAGEIDSVLKELSSITGFRIRRQLPFALISREQVNEYLKEQIRQTVKPDEGKTGDKVTITGTNFGATGCLSSVSFGPGSPATFVHVNESTVTATVPSGKKGIRLLTVTTASGEDSKPFFVK